MTHSSAWNISGPTCSINTPKSYKNKVPEGVENSAIAEDAYEAVFHRDVMQEGALGVWDEGVRDPEQGHEASVHTDALISREHQPGVTPPLTEEDSCCVVLTCWRKEDKSFIQSPIPFFIHTLTHKKTNSGKSCIPYWFLRWRQCWRYRDSFQSQQDPLSQTETQEDLEISTQITAVEQLLLVQINHQVHSYHWN